MTHKKMINKKTGAIIHSVIIAVIIFLPIQTISQQPHNGGGNITGFCDAGGPYTGVIDIPIQFQGSTNGSYPPFTYEWDFDYNGTFNTESTQLSPTWTYTVEGTYIAALRVTDNTTNTSISTTQVFIYNDENTQPITHFSWNPGYPEAGQTIYFTDLSYDLDGYIASWEWSFGDGATSSIQNPSHMYGLPGSYKVFLKVTDNEGGNSTTYRNVIVYHGEYYEKTKNYSIAIYTVCGRYPIENTEIGVLWENESIYKKVTTDMQGYVMLEGKGFTKIWAYKEGYTKQNLSIDINSDMKIIIQMEKTEDILFSQTSAIILAIIITLIFLLGITYSSFMIQEKRIKKNKDQ